jgi:hypothetical protein
MGPSPHRAIHLPTVSHDGVGQMSVTAHSLGHRICVSCPNEICGRFWRFSRHTPPLGQMSGSFGHRATHMARVPRGGGTWPRTLPALNRPPAAPRCRVTGDPRHGNADPRHRGGIAMTKYRNKVRHRRAVTRGSIQHARPCDRAVDSVEARTRVPVSTRRTTDTLRVSSSTRTAIHDEGRRMRCVTQELTGGGGLGINPRW